MRSSEIRKFRHIEPLLLRIERSQLKWFAHVSRMPQERLPKQALLAKANGKRSVGWLRSTVDGPITLRILDGIAWDFTQAKWWKWSKTEKCGGLISSCCPCNLHSKTGNEERKDSAGARETKCLYLWSINGRVDGASVTEAVNPVLIPVRVKPKTIRIGIHNFPAWRLAAKGAVWSLRRVW